MSRKRRGGLGTVVKRVLGGLVLIGVVIGIWRYLGDGAALGSAEWFNNATDTVQGFIDWVQARARDLSQTVWPVTTEANLGVGQ